MFDFHTSSTLLGDGRGITKNYRNHDVPQSTWKSFVAVQRQHW